MAHRSHHVETLFADLLFCRARHSKAAHKDGNNRNHTGPTGSSASDFEVDQRNELNEKHQDFSRRYEVDIGCGFIANAPG